MADIKTMALIIPKFGLILLIAILMILWVVLTVQSVKDINMRDAEHKKFSINNRDPNAEKYDVRNYNRARGMTIFNLLFELTIAIVAMIGIFKMHRYVLQTSIFLLTIIWFVSEFRITDVYWNGPAVMIASHVILFFVWVIGLIIGFFTNGEDREKSSKVFGTENSSPA